MNDVVLRIPANTQSSDEIIKKSVSEVTISTALLPGAELSYVIENIKNPDEVGPSSWEITTYLDTTIKDAKLNAEGFEVLVRIDVDTRESKADPRVYGAKESTIYFSMMSSHLLHGGSVLELYAPPGYVFYNNSFVSLSGIVEVEGQHGSELVSFHLSAMLIGENYVSLEITAPKGFKFSIGSSCVTNSSTEDQWSVFNDCNSDENVATLTTATNVLNAGQTIIDMVCVNPDATPLDNSWRLALYLDANISHYWYIQVEDGYEIKAMEAQFLGSNRLGVSAPGFFTFVSSQEIVGPIQIDITPPVGYELKCTPSYRVGLLTPPQCEEQIGTTGSAIKLQFSEVSIDQGIGFTVAIEIVNPGAPLTPDPDTGISRNTFELILRDTEGNTIDANMAVLGMDLANVPIIGSALAWDAVEAQSISKVQIVLKISRDMQPEEVLEIHVEAPQDVAMTAPSNVVLSDNIPVSDVAPVSVAGNRLIIRLMRASLSLGLVTEVEGLREGTVIINFSVKNPSQLPNANYWVVKMLGEDRVLVFQHVFEGYSLS
ncbi:hypothetical protein Pmar_PMAR013622 [Perkinsus marinus ATCC 50983]|uniref:Uncharacterized protein n=1 Tax=Perkinsus marinus (strain ATCC 50983 / TXsc) TaxID=423536 RepID=C5KP55_PERM5|nr:hypothetical protein Pmar_PMAR013622 [Perkinsus marinus ATCC 50983]EER13730.1 hypothetical protein Pmar_PMAR013622 [Perkinsus marinus ATCC 50983]|eukprot:XP_002781935.1 hypothetical protein Pmar_PMAR013622 [Perkinsus marinus ATCC 50983]